LLLLLLPLLLPRLPAALLLLLKMVPAGAA
jgi:hypothetical protein